MKLSTRARYGLRAVIDLGLNSESEAVSLQSIANRQMISVSYLEQLMALLKKAGIVTSSRGANGGYKLAKSPDEISVGSVLTVLEGGLDAASCPGSLDSAHCEGPGHCVAKLVWEKINESINNTVNSMMLGDLIRQSRDGNKTVDITKEDDHEKNNISG
ncbi:MAG: RrF2 family transcriptional regulator [Eubacteriales bacterium]|nr:RrF2 family transcriptional regulator [Eubacteriales bacterium]